MFKLKEIIKWPSGKQILFRRGKHRAYSCRDANFFSKAYLLTPWIKIKTKPIASTIDSIAERKSRITRLIIAIIWIFQHSGFLRNFAQKTTLLYQSGEFLLLQLRQFSVTYFLNLILNVSTAFSFTSRSDL